MRKLLKNPLVSGGLALVAVALVASSLMDDKRPRSNYNAAPATAEATNDDYGQSNESDFGQTPSLATTFDIKAILDLSAQTAPRNLFARPAPPVTAASGDDTREQALATATLQVKGVWVQGGLRYVVIGDKTLSPGQSLDRVIVERIETHGVWIGHSGESHFLKPGESWSYQYPVPHEVARN